MGTNEPALFLKYRSLVNDALMTKLIEGETELDQVLQYSLGIDAHESAEYLISARPGKRIRPILCMFVCELMGGNIKDILHISVAIELIHQFSLIHDDIQDRDVMRHHKSSVWVLCGDMKALFAGNALRTTADITAWDSNFCNNNRLDVGDLLNNACLRMTEGQCLDLLYEGELFTHIDQYIEMISLKTGALVSASVEIGACVSLKGCMYRDVFKSIGMYMGIILQIRDDMLGIWGDPDNTGKAIGSDIKRKKNTIPVVHTMAVAEKQDRKELLRIYNKPELTNQDVLQVLDIMDDLKTLEFTQNILKRYLDKTEGLVNKVSDDVSGIEDILVVTDFLMKRDH
ncbi:MAG: hypothetical protein CL760_12120 [Chloroflexi bacterium]|nr:hypothetical protein [Chloroflexota bacterium]